MKSAQELKGEGNQAFKEGEYEKAVELYSQAIEKDASDVSFFSNRAACYLNLKQYEKALEDANQCITINPKFNKGYLRKSVALTNLGQKEEALKTVEEGLVELPDDSAILQEKKKLETPESPQMNLQELLNNPMIQDLIKKNPQMAQQLFQNPEMLKNPQMMQMMMNMFAQQQSQQPQPPQNSEQFNQFNPGQEEEKPEPQQQAPQQEQQNKPSEFEETKKKGNQHYMKKEFEQAIQAYDQCIALDKHELLVRNNKAACYIELKNLDKALEVIEEAIQTYQESPVEKKKFEDLAKVLARKGRIYELKKDISKAIEIYEKSLLENYVGKISAKVKELKRLLKKEQELAYINPELSEEHRNKGNTLFKESKFAEAIKEYEEAVKRNPEDVRPHNNLASCFIKLMRYDAALAEVEKCLKIEPDNLKAQIKKGQIYIFTKQYHKAVEEFEKILAKNPENQQAKKLLMDTQIKIQSSMGGEQDEERAKRAMQDPEIQAIMMDPMVRIALEQMQQNPQKAMEYFKDPTLAPKIQKLVQAGILRLG